MTTPRMTTATTRRVAWLGAASAILIGTFWTAATRPRALSAFTCTLYRDGSGRAIYLVEPQEVDDYAAEAVVDLFADRRTGEVEVKGHYRFLPTGGAQRVNLRPGVLMRGSLDPEWRFFFRDRDGRRTEIPIDASLPRSSRR